MTDVNGKTGLERIREKRERMVCSGFVPLERAGKRMHNICRRCAIHRIHHGRREED